MATVRIYKVAELLDTMIVLHEASEDTHGVKLERSSVDGRRLSVTGDQDEQCSKAGLGAT